MIYAQSINVAPTSLAFKVCPLQPWPAQQVRAEECQSKWTHPFAPANRPCLAKLGCQNCCKQNQKYTWDLDTRSRLRQEAACCATISVIYARQDSALHITEPKYTLQDVVTTVSGNIEAWIGLSALHAYLFVERLFELLAADWRR